MKRTWENHELAEHWTIEQADHQLIRQKRGVNRLGFALLRTFRRLVSKSNNISGREPPET